MMTSSLQSSQVCKYFLKDGCVRGNDCRYTHSAPLPCTFFLQGTCRRGDGCRFSHSRTNPPTKASDWNVARLQRAPEPRKGGTFGVCKFFSQGRCMKGDTCPFPHVAEGKTTVSAFHSIRSPPVVTISKDTHEVDSILTSLITVKKSGTISAIGPSKNVDGNGVNDKTIAQGDTYFDRTKLGCRVTYGAGASILGIQTAFESCNVVLFNIPATMTTEKLTEFVEPFGECLALTIDRSSGDTSRLTGRLEYADTALAARAVDSINNDKLGVGAKLDLRAVENGKSILKSTKVKVSWFAPTRIAWAHYSTILSARRRANDMDGKLYIGRKITANFQEPSRRQTKSFSVEIKGLPMNVDSQGLRIFSRADSVHIAAPIYTTDFSIKHIRLHLEEIGPLESFEPLPVDPTKPKIVAFAQFANADIAERAVLRLNGERVMNGSPIWLEHVHSLKYAIPNAQFAVLKAEIDTLRDRHSASKLRYHEVDEAGKKLDSVCIRTYSSDPTALGKLKAELELILKGELLTDKGGRVWDDYLASAEGLFFLRYASQKTSTFVKCETRHRAVRMYGTEANCDAVKAEIIRRLEKIDTQRHFISLERHELKALISGGLTTLERSVEGVSLVLDVVRCTIAVHGSTEDLRRVRHALAQLQTPQTTPSTDDAEICCPVCFCEPTDPLALACGHSFCRTCLQHFLRSPPSSNFSGKRCIVEVADGGDLHECGQAIPSSIIRDALSPTEEEDLLDASLLAHIRSRPSEFHYCPTPDCEVVYRPGADGSVVRCPSCLVRVCTSCHVEFHEGLDCASYRDNLEGGNAAYREWRERNDVKSCPKCTADLEKNGGCNHMTCIQCGTHMCWVCMQTFADADSGKGVYAHMRKAHGGHT